MWIPLLDHVDFVGFIHSHQITSPRIGIAAITPSSAFAKDFLLLYEYAKKYKSADWLADRQNSY